MKFHIFHISNIFHIHFGAWVRTSYFSVKCRMPDLSARVESNAVASVASTPGALPHWVGLENSRCRLGLAKCLAPRNTTKKLLIKTGKFGIRVFGGIQQS